MNWTQEEPTPREQTILLRREDILLSVDGADRHWQHFMLSFGVFSEATTEECKATWPREAIAVARRKLDEFEEAIAGPREAMR